MAAAELNIPVDRGTTMRVPLRLENKDCTPMNLTGLKGVSEVRDKECGKLVAIIDVQIVDPPTSGNIVLYMAASQTQKIKQDSVLYDVMFQREDNADEVDKLVYGEITMRDSTTKPNKN